MIIKKNNINEYELHLDSALDFEKAEVFFGYPPGKGETKADIEAIKVTKSEKHFVIQKKNSEAGRGVIRIRRTDGTYDFYLFEVKE